MDEGHSSVSGSKKGSASPFDRLPDGILASILTRSTDVLFYDREMANAADLARLQTVCSRFHRIALEVGKLHFDLRKLDMRACEGSILERLYSGSRHITSLLFDMNPAEVLCSGLITSFARCAPKLESFNLNGARLDCQGPDSDTMTHQLLKSLSSCPQLATLNLTGSFNDHNAVSLTRALSSKRPFQNLKHVMMDHIDFSDSALGSLMEQCPVLEDFRAWYVTGLEEGQIKTSSLQKLLLVTRTGCRSLEVLAPQLVEVTLDGFEEVRIDAPSLLSLNVGQSSISRLQPWKIEELHMRGLWEPGNVMSLLQVCSGANMLFFGGDMNMTVEPGDHAVINLISDVRRFRYVEALYLHADMVRLLEWPAGPAFKSLKRLSIELPLGEEVYIDHCVNLVEGSPNLERLDLSFSGRDASLQAIDLMVRFIELQKRFPNLEITVHPLAYY